MHTVRCKTLTLTLDDLGRPTSLRLAPIGYEFLAAGSPPTGLWQLGLIRPVRYDDPLPALKVPTLPYQQHEWWINRHEYRADLALDSDDESIAPPTITADGSTLTLAWSFPLPDSSVPGRLTLRILGGAEHPRIEFRASVDLPDAWAIKRLTFPRLRGLGDPTSPHDDALLYPENWGVLRRNPLEDMTNYIGQYPGSANSSQMAAWLHKRNGLYLGMLDPETHHTGIDAQYVEGHQPAPWECERWHVREPARPAVPWAVAPLGERLAAGKTPAIQLRCNHWPSMLSRWECPYPVVLQGFTGTWFEAAKIHREWATKQRWCRRGRLADRKDASPALLGLDLWFSRYGFHPASFEPTGPEELRKAMLDLHQFFGSPFGLHWYHWHNFSWHSNFPAHSPTVPGFEQVKDELQSLGVVIMPYCQGRLIYRDRETFDDERTHASLESNGQPYFEMYTPQDDYPLALCPGDAWAQGQWREAARMLWRHYGVEGVYFDQITAMPPSLCYHAGHGHALGGGTQYWAGYDQALESMKPMIDEDPTRFLSSELMADAFMDRIDLYLAFVPPIEDYVPLHAAIYSGYTFVMGRATPTQVMESPQLFAIAQGEQFLFGGQLGWMNEAILQFPVAAKYLRDLVRLRAKVRDILHLGSMEAPLEDLTPGSRLVIELPTYCCAKDRPVRLERQAVVNTVWRGPASGGGGGGRVLVMLLNESTAPVELTVPARADWPEGTWSQWTLGSDEPALVEADGAFKVKLPPLGVAALVSC
ncbi:MAG: DUF6259 domain-containing protein [Planctomycetota bacterium]|nr:DUF6259 domain-containing protein [Planctomycetota bacterium]